MGARVMKMTARLWSPWLTMIMIRLLLDGIFGSALQFIASFQISWIHAKVASSSCSVATPPLHIPSLSGDMQNLWLNMC